jgi:hypothetical protein
MRSYMIQYPPTYVIMILTDRLGDQRERGASEWEPIKILLEGDRNSNKTNLVGYPKSHAPHSTFRLPKPRSH